MNGTADVDAPLLRALAPEVLNVLVRRGADFATAEDAVQDAIVKALTAWPNDPPRDPKGWLITTAWHAFIDLARSESARRGRELRVDAEPPAGEVPSVDDTLRLYFLCAHPALTPASAVALTLRAVGGLTTAQIAQAYLVPEATMAQRISRAKRAVSDLDLDQPGDLATVMHVLYLVFNEGYSGDVDLAAEAIRLTRQLATMTDDPEVAGLLALMLLHHARRSARTRPDGSLVTLAEQDRSRWDVALISEGVATAAVGARARPARPVSGPSCDRRAPRGCTTGGGDRLGADRRLVRRVAPAHRYAGRPAQPGRRGRRGRRSPGRAGGVGRGCRRRPASQRRRRPPPRAQR